MKMAIINFSGGSDTRSSLSILLLILLVNQIHGQCPLSKNDTDLANACSCSYIQSKLNIQCSSVNLTKLLTALRDSEEKQPIELLHVNNCSQSIIADDSFYNLRVTTIHFAQCKIRNISTNAFRDLEDSLKSLNLPDNQLNEDSLVTVRKLRGLTSLDLSNNEIKQIPTNAFKGLALDTLNLMGNNLSDSISSGAFQGLEKTLKNLNLKGTGLTKLPAAIRNLTGIAFLDLAQNSVQDSPPKFFINMESLTALSLERNQLHHLDSDTFAGLSDTMTSLSLLNNQFHKVPTQAIATLKELRVLDLGFNQITVIAENDFLNVTSLTLLALDGNPLSTLPFEAFKHLRTTLKGLSIGGRSFVCDCNIRWITEWVREYDLQVTSRERNPQFCGHPSAQRNKNLYLLRPAQLVCPETTTAAPTSTTSTTTETTTAAKTTVTTPTTPAATTQTITSKTPEITSNTHFPTTVLNTTPSTTTATTSTKEIVTETLATTTTSTTTESSFSPPLLVRSTQNQRAARKDNALDIHIREAYREDSTIVISWDVASSDVPGYRVIYRTFGDSGFTKRADLSLRVRKFRLTNVPPNECLVVCVISTDESVNITADGVPRANCRELKSESHMAAGHAEIDKIVIIAALAAICAAVIIAVIIFVCCNRRRRVKQHPLPPPIVTLPPLEPMKPEWDNASAYSSRSIPRARMYHMGRNGGSVNSAFLPDDARSHLSHMSSKHPDPGGSIINGGQYHGYMNPAHTNTLPNPYPLGRPETNRSSKSLAQMSYQGTNNRKKRTQPRNGKWSSMSNSGSVHSLSGYDTENGYFHPNPWSGSEMDHYPSGNHMSQPYTKRDYT